MNRVLAKICLTALLFPVGNAFANETRGPVDENMGTLNIVGMLICKTVPHSGLDLLIHSIKGVRCTFNPTDGGPVGHYKGETGIEFGINVGIDNRKYIRYSVIARHFRAGTHQLAGKYSGVGGGAILGLSVGNSAPLRKNNGGILLQPVTDKDSGADVDIGLSYLYLEADGR